MGGLRKLLSTPPHILLQKAISRTQCSLAIRRTRWRDSRQSTYGGFSPDEADLETYIQPLPTADLRPYAPQIAALAQYALVHYFDLLGSGWVQVVHGMYCAGVEGFRHDPGRPVSADSEGEWLRGRINPANLPEAKRIWQLIGGRYVPIDWHLDFKSGYRWNESCWYRDIPYGHLPGVDVKVPWELARGQHLPQLAWAYALASVGEPGFEAPERYVREFRSQVLDFIATNPPRLGVNWACAMDVGIRIASWLITYDLFRAYGAIFDPTFVRELKRSAIQHTRHIMANREWQPEWRSNHYLANIAGVLTAAAYLASDPEVDSWLAFALREMDRETGEQFHLDGSNFEASTCYHRLSAEMVVYAAALALGLSPEKQAVLRPEERLFPQAQSMRLEKMAEFVFHLTKPSGHMPQIGDHDSGRFLKLFPVYHPMPVSVARSLYVNLEGYRALPGDQIYWDEDLLDHRHLVAAINGLFGRSDFAAFADSPETTLVQGIAKGHHLPSYHRAGSLSAAEEVRFTTGNDTQVASLFTRPGVHRLEITGLGDGLRDNLRTYAYPDFGLYLFRSRRLYLAVRCGPVGQHGSGGHAHNDQLTLELAVDGEDWVTDPGTYLYTPLPVRRNEYRSVKAHFAPQLLEGEPGRLDLGLFQLGNEARAECLFFGPEGFLGVHQGYGSPLYRRVTLDDDRIVIEDVIEDGRTLRAWAETRWPTPGAPALSPKYGSRQR